MLNSNFQISLLPVQLIQNITHGRTLYSNCARTCVEHTPPYNLLNIRNVLNISVKMQYIYIINIFVVYLQKRAYNDTYHIHVYSLTTTEMYRSPTPLRGPLIGE